MVTQPDEPQRIARLTPVADLIARIDALVAPVEPGPLEIARAGHVLACDVMLGPHPRAPLALRDGWAVRADLTSDASSYAPAPLPAATRIDVGQYMPAGADAVAPLDVVVTRAGRTEITAPVAPGEGVLPAGGDGDRRVPWLQQGRQLTPLQTAVLAAVGAGDQTLYVREPQVRLARSRADRDAVIDAAIKLIAGEISAVGGDVLDAHSDADAPLATALADADADAIIAIGGTGSGTDDRSVHTLARVGRLEVHGIALAPGETAAFGFVGSRPVLLLPGRLDAALAVWLVIGRHLLARLSGSAEPELVTKAKLDRKVSSPLGLTEVVPVRLRDGAAEPIASGYVPLSALAQADGWLLVPPDSEGFPPGAEVVIRACP
jgi:molybdopterin biosynthesis enzyme